ncbi:MAG: AmmeMemoRadiSam system protein A [Anaerolineaceae bacterium]
MNPSELTSEEKKTLLKLARQTIEAVASGKHKPSLTTEQLTPALRAHGAVFVTLTIGGELRGCIGSLQAFRPLVDDVQDHSVDAALHDYRFMPVSEEEVPLLKIEISQLTIPLPLEFADLAELPAKLKPNIDGVVLHDGVRSATFLPQVWEQLPDPESFLSQLCLKMGASADLWRRKKLQVSIYHVDEFHE